MWLWRSPFLVGFGEYDYHILSLELCIGELNTGSGFVPDGESGRAEQVRLGWGVNVGGGKSTDEKKPEKKFITREQEPEQ